MATASTPPPPPETLVRRSAARRPVALQNVRTEIGSPKCGKASTFIRARRTSQSPRPRSCERDVEGFGGRGRGAINGGFVMGERDEPRLELRRRRIDTALEQGAAEATVSGQVAGRSALEVTHRRGAEERGHEPAHRDDLDRAISGGLP